MVETNNITFKIINYIIVAVKIIFKAVRLLIHYLWLIILSLYRYYTTKEVTKENESPLISEDNSEASEGEDTEDVLKVENQFAEDSSPRVVAIPSTSEGTELRKRAVMISDDMGGHCQVCGVTTATIRCQGPRCYKFFCLSCDTLYHQHPRRESHIRLDIGADIPTVKTMTLSEEVENSFANKQENALEVVDKTHSDKNVHKDLVSTKEEMVHEMPSSSTSWHCSYCTIPNECSLTVCKICSKTNITLIESAEELLENEPSKQSSQKKPTTLTKKSTNKNDVLYNTYWNSPDVSKSNLPPSEDDPNVEVAQSYQTRSTRGRNSHNTTSKSQDKNASITLQEEFQNTASKNASVILQEELSEKGAASGITKTSSEPTGDTPSVWKCAFCTFENDLTFNICEMCSKSNVKKLVMEIGQTREGDSARSAYINTDTDDVALGFMQRHYIENYDVAKLTSILVKHNFRFEDAIEAAKNCSSFDECLAYLEQDCQLCRIKNSKQNMIKMLYCNHELCRNCTRKYFTKQINTNDITSFVCPLCQTPKPERIETFDDSISEYFSNLSDLLKPILRPEDHEKYQMKLRDWFLRKSPLYKKCPHCPYAGLMDDDQIWLECPTCNLKSCLQCKKNFLPNHAGKSCEELAAWEEAQKNNEFNKKNKQQQQNNQGTKKGLLAKLIGYPKKSEQKPDSYASAANSSKTTKSTQNQEDINRHVNNNYNYESEYPNIQHHSQENTPTRPNQNPYNNTNAGAISKIKTDHARSTNNPATPTMGYNATERNCATSQEQIISAIALKKWDCTNCTLINDASTQRCVSCNRTNSRNFERSLVGDFNLASHQQVGNQNNIHSENLARVHNFNDSQPLINDRSFSSDTPLNATIASSEMSAQTAMDWQQSHNSTSELYQKKGDEITKVWDLKKEAIINGFTFDELEIAIFHCNDNNPIQWLKKEWINDIAYVKLTASRELNKFDHLNSTNTPPITNILARNALIKCFGNCREAVNDCIEENLRNFKELQLNPNARHIFPEASTNQAIYPNQTLVAANTIYNPPPTNEIIYSHQELRNAGFVLPNNSNYASIVQSHFSRIDSAVERSANILKQSAGLTTIQNQTTIIQPQYDGVGTSTRPDGVHLAQPAIADYKQNETD